jgi:hypothetical protein
MINLFSLKLRQSDHFDDSLRGKITSKGGRGYNTHLTGKIRAETIIYEKNTPSMTPPNQIKM